MSLKPTAFRAGTEADPLIIGTISTGSDNGCGANRTDSDFKAGSDSCGNGGEDAITARFWAKVNRDGPVPLHRPSLGSCWLWTASLFKDGYGQFVLPRQHGKQRHVYAHRFAYQLTYGPLGSAQANHHCDVPRCVRPSHLFAGSQQDNLADARAKGRLDESRPRHRVLSPADRLTIYAARKYRGVCVDLARQYGVTKTCITHIRKGRFAGAPIDRGQAALNACFERVPHIELPVIGEVA